MLAGYGHDGLRAWRTANGATIFFLYDGMDPVVQLSSLGVVNVVNDFGANGLLARHSQFYPPAGDLDRYNAYDPQGNTAEIVACKNGTGAATLLESATYDAFGARTTNPTTYAGDSYSGFGAQWRYFQDQTEPLELLGHRYYDAASGRFVTRDPIGYGGGTNVYRYAQDRPATVLDPTGYSPNSDCKQECGDEFDREEAIIDGLPISDSGKAALGAAALAAYTECIRDCNRKWPTPPCPGRTTVPSPSPVRTPRPKPIGFDPTGLLPPPIYAPFPISGPFPPPPPVLWPPAPPAPCAC